MKTAFPIFAAVLILRALPSYGEGYEPSVIYGEDNRFDYFEISDSKIKDRSRSIVALFKVSEVNWEAGAIEVAKNTYGRAEKLCAGERFIEQPVSAFCSGSLVGPDLVLTAGHCIKEDADCAATLFGFDYRMDSAFSAHTRIEEKDFYTCKEIVARKYHRSGVDYALIRLDSVVSDRPVLRMDLSARVSAGDEMLVLGFPMGLPLKATLGARVRDVKKGFFVTDADTFAGNSGSPVFGAKTGEVQGVLVRGELDLEYDSRGKCYRERRCAAGGCGGESATFISELAKIMSWKTPQPTLEEATGEASPQSGQGQARIRFRIPNTVFPKNVSVRFEAFDRNSGNFEIFQESRVLVFRSGTSTRAEFSLALPDPEALLLGAVKVRITLLIDGAGVDSDSFSVFGLEPLSRGAR